MTQIRERRLNQSAICDTLKCRYLLKGESCDFATVIFL